MLNASDPESCQLKLIVRCDFQLRQARSDWRTDKKQQVEIMSSDDFCRATKLTAHAPPGFALSVLATCQLPVCPIIRCWDVGNRPSTSRREKQERIQKGPEDCDQEGRWTAPLGCGHLLPRPLPWSIPRVLLFHPIELATGSHVRGEWVRFTRHAD